MSYDFNVHVTPAEPVLPGLLLPGFTVTNHEGCSNHQEMTEKCTASSANVHM